MQFKNPLGLSKRKENESNHEYNVRVVNEEFWKSLERYNPK